MEKIAKTEIGKLFDSKPKERRLVTFRGKKYRELQALLPAEITLALELNNTEITDDEFAVAKDWIRYFNNHFKKYGFTKYPEIIFARCSKSLKLDFGLYIANFDEETRFDYKLKTPYIIYLHRDISLVKKTNNKLRQNCAKHKIYNM